MAVLGMRGNDTLTVNVNQIAAVKAARRKDYRPCQHPGWYAVFHIDGIRILAYACTDCARTKLIEEAMERVLAEGQERV